MVERCDRTAEAIGSNPLFSICTVHSYEVEIASFIAVVVMGAVVSTILGLESRKQALPIERQRAEHS